MTEGESADATAVDAVAVDAAAVAEAAPPKQSATEVCAAQLDAIGWGCFSSELLLLAGLGWISDGAEAAVLSYMLPALGTQYSLDEERLGQLSSLLSLAQAVGAAFWGRLADVAGRRPAFLGSVGLTAVLGIASAWATSLPAYVALRAATGFAIGGNLPLAVTVTSELLPPRHRDRCLIMLHLFYEVGALSSTGLAVLLMPESCAEGTRCNWQTYLLLVALPAAAVSLVALCRLPESAVWLASKGRHESARAVLGRIQRLNNMRRGGRSQTQALDIVDLPPPADGAAAAASDGGGRAAACKSWAQRMLPTALFGWAMLRTTGCVTLLWFSADAASGWWTWLPYLASAQHVPASIMYTSSIVGRVAASGAFLVAAGCVSYFSARAMLLFAICVVCALSALLTYWANAPALFASTSFVGVYGSFALFFGGVWSLMYVVTPLAFPPSLRGSGFGLASACGKLGQLVSPLVAGALVSTSVIAMGVFFTGTWALAALCLSSVPRAAALVATTSRAAAEP